MIASLSAVLAVSAADAPFSLPAAPAAARPIAGRPERSPADRRAIDRLLAAYTRAVSTGDEPAFAKLLLNENVPFLYVGPDTFKHASNIPTLQNYVSFKDAVFRSGHHYRQAFYNVEIAQDGPLARASLEFVTLDAESGKGVWGWKTLQLLKVRGSWKIVGELYTAHNLA